METAVYLFNHWLYCARLPASTRSCAEQKMLANYYQRNGRIGEALIVYGHSFDISSPWMVRLVWAEMIASYHKCVAVDKASLSKAIAVVWAEMPLTTKLCQRPCVWW